MQFIQFKQFLAGLALLMITSLSVVSAQQTNSDYLKEREQRGAEPIQVAGESDLGWSFYYPDEQEALFPKLNFR